MKSQRPTHQEIAARAYEIYLSRGARDGHDRDDWLQAEYELMQLPVRKLAELSPPKTTKSLKPVPSIVHVVRDALFMNRPSPDNRPYPQP